MADLKGIIKLNNGKVYLTSSIDLSESGWLRGRELVMVKTPSSVINFGDECDWKKAEEIYKDAKLKITYRKFPPQQIEFVAHM